MRSGNAVRRFPAELSNGVELIDFENVTQNVLIPILMYAGPRAASQIKGASTSLRHAVNSLTPKSLTKINQNNSDTVQLSFSGSGSVVLIPTLRAIVDYVESGSTDGQRLDDVFGHCRSLLKDREKNDLASANQFNHIFHSIAKHNNTMASTLSRLADIDDARLQFMILARPHFILLTRLKLYRNPILSDTSRALIHNQIIVICLNLLTLLTLPLLLCAIGFLKTETLLTPFSMAMMLITANAAGSFSAWLRIKLIQIDQLIEAFESNAEEA